MSYLIPPEKTIEGGLVLCGKIYIGAWLKERVSFRTNAGAYLNPAAKWMAFRLQLLQRHILRLNKQLMFKGGFFPNGLIGWYIHHTRK